MNGNNESEKPKICKFLGLEVGERFRISIEENSLSIDENGFVVFADEIPDGADQNFVDYMLSLYAIKIVLNPNIIIRCTKGE